VCRASSRSVPYIHLIISPIIKGEVFSVAGKKRKRTNHQRAADDPLREDQRGYPKSTEYDTLFLIFCQILQRRWTPEEHRLFLQGIMLYGKDWKSMQPLIKTRTLVQIRTHAQKVFKKVGLKKIQKNMPVSVLETMEAGNDPPQMVNRFKNKYIPFLFILIVS